MKKLIILALVCFVSNSSLAIQNATPCQQESCEPPSFYLTALVAKKVRPINTLAVDLLDPPAGVVIASCEAHYDDEHPHILEKCKRSLKAFVRDLCD